MNEYNFTTPDFDVPENTIAVFKTFSNEHLPKERIDGMVKRSERKRDWFNGHFYKCLPLTIGNQYGFTVHSEYDIQVMWDGTNGQDGLSIGVNKDIDGLYPSFDSNFGFGILTLNPPFTLKTPPGVNLMTINPPNVVIPNITVMTGVVETDNLHRNFTFNLKIQMPNIVTTIPKGTPLAAFIPIPRYFQDKFELKMAEDIFSDNQIIEEMQIHQDFDIHRSEVEPTLVTGVGRFYFSGEDVYGNKFPDHQKP